MAFITSLVVLFTLFVSQELTGAQPFNSYSNHPYLTGIIIPHYYQNDIRYLKKREILNSFPHHIYKRDISSIFGEKGKTFDKHRHKDSKTSLGYFHIPFVTKHHKVDEHIWGESEGEVAGVANQPSSPDIIVPVVPPPQPHIVVVSPDVPRLIPQPGGFSFGGISSGVLTQAMASEGLTQAANTGGSLTGGLYQQLLSTGALSQAQSNVQMLPGVGIQQELMG
ncbi:hypothetical protein L9F63_021718 [Diploptera punctata]|uniref:Uncharacterized protein n=1 Tax=Diploptera punctata TaxID=6984 RepID=A0AAD7ZNF1_DIPPU|nr:hypothetical protein L9F63_021718 [Diploptera punctata]